MKQIWSIFLIAMMTLTGAIANAAPVVILSGEVNGQGPGSLVEETTVISLPAGALLMFNDASGQTKTLTGPFEGPINAEPSGAAAASGLDRLIASRSEEQSRLGAIRAAPGQVPRDADLISIAQSSVQCLPIGVDAQLWRPQTLNADSFFTLSQAGTGTQAKSVWHADVDTVDWPATVPLVSGGRYLVELEIAPRPIEVTLYLAPEDFGSDADLAAWMGQVGCRRQAFALLDRVSN